MSFYGKAGLCSLAAAMAVAVGSDRAYAQDTAGDGAPECVPLAEQYPELGTSQSISARREFAASWGSFELPGGPCGYPSAEEHYNALLADAESRGGPTVHDQATLPDWTGHWGTDNNTGELAIVGLASTTEGMAARLTPEASATFLYDARMWREGHAIDPISFCLPPNFPRWVTEYGYREHFLSPDKALLGSEMMNQFRRIFTDGRTHPSDEWMTNEWLGYSIGFWDGDVLTIWTRGIKEGILQRNMPRQSNEMEVIERWRRVEPLDPDSLGRIEIEITMYDPNFVEPWHTVAAYYKEDDRTAELKERVWPHQWDCEEGSNWYITDDGIVSQYAPGEKPDITDPDYWFNEDYIHR